MSVIQDGNLSSWNQASEIFDPCRLSWNFHLINKLDDIVALLFFEILWQSMFMNIPDREDT